jgi:hypothetical protein
MEARKLGRCSAVRETASIADCAAGQKPSDADALPGHKVSVHRREDALLFPLQGPVGLVVRSIGSDVHPVHAQHLGSVLERHLDAELRFRGHDAPRRPFAASFSDLFT